MTVILNASAGWRNRTVTVERVSEAFHGFGLYPRILVPAAGSQMAAAARQAVRDGEPVVVAGGGDGTVSAVASAMAGLPCTLGVLPLGTLNHFAKDVGIPLDLDGAAQTIAEGHTVCVDVGELNGRTFINNSSLGLYPQIVLERVEQQRRGHGKWFALLRATLTSLRRFPFLMVRLSADGAEVPLKTPFVLVGNNEYQLEGLGLGSRARLDGGLLWVYATRCGTRRCLLRLAADAALGRLRGAPDFDALCAREIWVETPRHRLRVALDGEVAVLEAPLHYRVRPGALCVLAPR